MRRAAQMSNTRALRPRRVACANWPMQSGLRKVIWTDRPMRRAARFGLCDDLRAAAVQASACRAPAPPWAGIGLRDAGAPSDPNARNTPMGKASGRSIKVR